ncbi:MAG: FCSD flavin-binding domain-containing protein [SAR324 cluster bacterium]|jgi:sulfide dehydrogenase [flavocytochrome c] flavoprotein subunit|nr:FCSD flavin-binding domain-containing protein [SAR324 cluster bacterium]MEE1577111.1 FCSD flavin-binding domain-containing protein [Deltaproteobacteria bacterium]MDP6247398.1 FCSD flavin-binding domain-containing protein [SAR324 cluster bacterium]MDP7138283.1 FCSD flavin-binding domain-containing protein [SAR324 cluster bacterium]MDP7332746.1 FCSD flavin-binding domain-containing protein [SAR324 cluster bacterium]|tara:strand:- start:985 stop:2262 length:1278 start_codon:yes stop_codon:yes gene_type:complete
MKKISRRHFGKMAATVGMASTIGMPSLVFGASRKVVVIGGGFGGATAAKYLRKLNSNLEVTLVEPNPTFYTCPFSNTVLGGFKSMSDIGHGYGALKNKHGVNIIHARAQSVDGNSKAVTLEGGRKLSFDRAVVSPGIDFRFDSMEGYNQSATEKMPHSWQAGPQTALLRKQLEAMPDGGTVLICPPGNPFRCPPGPYERTSLIAHYLKNHKPKSKIIVLDAKEKFSKQGLFMSGWDLHYGDLIEWRAASSGGKISRVDPSNMQVETEFGMERGDVINFIPAQQAGKIARDSGLANSKGWCPVNQLTFESTQQPGVHVIGDSCIAGKMPKSGFSANSQGKVAAASIVSLLDGTEPIEPSYANTCYSLVTPNHGISVAKVYKISNNTIVGVKGSGGLSPKSENASVRQKEAEYAQGWYDAITQDMFG